MANYTLIINTYIAARTVGFGGSVFVPSRSAPVD